VVGGDEEGNELAGGKLVQPLARLEPRTRGGERRRGGAPRTIGKPARATPLEIVAGEPRVVRSLRRHERADVVALEPHIEPQGDAFGGGGDQHRLDEGTEPEQQVPPCRVTGGQVSLRVEAEPHPVGLVRQAPRLRVVRRGSAIERPLEASQRAKVDRVGACAHRAERSRP
jgi:hypothetical protein